MEFDDSSWSDDQQALAREVAAEHERHPHPSMTPARTRLHLLLHVVAETQIRRRDPAAAAEALARLMGAGVGRHEAVHAICQVVAEEVVQVVGSERSYDAARYAARLRALKPGDCIVPKTGSD